MKLLREFNPLDYDRDTIERSKAENGGRLVLRGILQKADTLNQNGRIYPRAILEREVMNYQKFINERRSLGECDHPDSSVVELKNVSHLVTKMEMDDDGVVHGEVEVLDTPCGKILQSLVEANVKLGISSRGVGSTVKEGDADVVQDDYVTITYDCVSEPSTPGAFLVEGKDLSLNEIRKALSKSDRVFRAANELLRIP